jgi:fibro-slime domain-containing protein
VSFQYDCGREKDRNFSRVRDDQIFVRASLSISCALLAVLGAGCAGDESDPDRRVPPGGRQVVTERDAATDDEMFGNSQRRDAGSLQLPDAADVTEHACGDGELLDDEACDDGNTRAGDGCSADCAVEPGWACLTAASPCIPAECGDGIVVGDEQCEDDDSPPADGDGCSALCRFEPGYDCPAAGSACHATVCNDGSKERGEPCDDGNQVVGDGCTPFCEVEPDCSTGACRSRCGDGLILASDNEQCDDGNTQGGDGCSELCAGEAGYACTLETDALPDVLRVPVTYRDFVARPAAAATRHPDFEIFSGADVTPALVQNTLGVDGKPVYAGICDTAMPTGAACPHGQQLTTAASFDQWYRDVPDVNVVKVTRMELMRDPADGAYRIQQAAFFPWDGDAQSWVGQGKENAYDNHDFGFTSEVRHYFTYTPDAANPQTLTFSGDDDVWVFINHRLAVDIGGLHSEQERSVQLDDAKALELGLQPDDVYEIALFHAERHTSQSNFNLTLSGFVSVRSLCTPRCGDGFVAGQEECDDGVNGGGYGGCLPDCTLGPRCGDRVTQQSAGEQCDDGNRLDGDTCTSDCERKGPG